MNDLDGIRSELLDAVGAAGSREALEQVRVAALGRKGRITDLMKGLGALDADSRKSAGARDIEPGEWLVGENDFRIVDRGTRN